MAVIENDHQLRVTKMAIARFWEVLAETGKPSENEEEISQHREWVFRDDLEYEMDRLYKQIICYLKIDRDRDPVPEIPGWVEARIVIPRTRILTNLSVVEVARHLKVRPEQVEHIEYKLLNRLPITDEERPLYAQLEDLFGMSLRSHAR